MAVKCPKCGKVIRKNQVDVYRFNWDAVIELGILGALLAPFLPHVCIKYQCEFCAKIFPIQTADSSRLFFWLPICSWLLVLAGVLYALWLNFTPQ